MPVEIAGAPARLEARDPSTGTGPSGWDGGARPVSCTTRRHRGSPACVRRPLPHRLGTWIVNLEPEPPFLILVNAGRLGRSRNERRFLLMPDRTTSRSWSVATSVRGSYAAIMVSLLRTSSDFCRPRGLLGLKCGTSDCPGELPRDRIAALGRWILDQGHAPVGVTGMTLRSTPCSIALTGSPSKPVPRSSSRRANQHNAPACQLGTGCQLLRKSRAALSPIDRRRLSAPTAPLPLYNRPATGRPGRAPSLPSSHAA